MSLNTRRNRSFVWLCSAIVCLSFVSLAFNVSASSSKQEMTKGPRIEKILILPFQEATNHHETGKTVRCFECNYFVQTGVIENGAGGFMNKQIETYFKTKTPYTAIPFWTLEWVTAERLSQDFRGADRSLLVEIGRSVKADAVFIGTIYRFKQRVGTSMAVDSPASVAFAMELIRVADGRIIWKRPFDETQKSLDKNLLRIGQFFKRGGQWLSAEELAKAGLTEAMASFPVQ